MNKKSVFAVLPLVAVLSLNVAGAETVIRYDASTYTSNTRLPSSTNNKLSISYNGGNEGGLTNVVYIYCTPAEGETIRLTGDDLKFADGVNSYILMQGHGTLVIENSVTKWSSAKDLVVKPDRLPAVPTNTYSGALVATTGVGTKVFENLRLEDYDPIAATQSAAAMPAAAEMQVVGLYRGYDADGNLFKQFQYQWGGAETFGAYPYVYRVVKVRLTQVGADVFARVISAFDLGSNLDKDKVPYIKPGFDVDTYRTGNVSGTAVSVPCRTTGETEGYGVDSLTLVRTKLPTVRFAGPVSVTSGSDYVSAQAGVRVEYASREWIGKTVGETRYTGSLQADAASETAIAGMPVLQEGVSRVSGRLIGPGTFTLLGEDPVYTYVCTNAQPITSSSTPANVVLCCTNDEATVVSGASAELTCTKTENVLFFSNIGEKVAATMYHLKEVTDAAWKTGKGDKRYRMQFQTEVQAREGSDVYILCAYLDVEINSTTGEVFVGPPSLPKTTNPTKADDYIGSACWVKKDDRHWLGMDFDSCIYGQDTGVTQFWDSSSFRIAKGLRLDFASARTGETPVNFSWSDQLAQRTSGTVCIRGTTNHYPVYSTQGGGLLTNQVFEIGPYGAMSVPNTSTLPLVVDPNRTFNVYQDGELRLHTSVSLTNRNSDLTATVVGGKIRCGVGAAANAYDCGGYLFQRVMLKDGADIVGKPMRVGNQFGSPSVSVAGEKPSTITAGYCIAGQGAAGTVMSNWSFTFAVADVTGDADADLIVNGPVKHYSNGGWTPGTVPVVKKGEGTVLFNEKTALNDNCPVSVDAGTWKLGASDVAQATLPFKLNGGALAAAAGTTNAMGPISLADDGAIVLDEGATLTVADSSAQDWAAGKLLNVSIPTNSTGVLQATLKFGGVTRAQMKKVRVNGAKAILTDDGEVVPGSLGTVVIIR